jgi:hypothetical protein
MARPSSETRLYQDIKTLIEQSRQRSASAINAEISLLYWNVGKRIKVDILKDERAEYGKGILDGLSAKLMEEYGRGWSHKQLRHCIQLATIFPNKKIFSAVRRKLSWTNLKTIIYIDEPLKRDFYIEMYTIEYWNPRILQDRIDSMLFERTTVNKIPNDVIKNEQMELYPHWLEKYKMRKSTHWPYSTFLYKEIME